MVRALHDVPHGQRARANAARALDRDPPGAFRYPRVTTSSRGTWRLNIRLRRAEVVGITVCSAAPSSVVEQT
jgi:hypothetical protein